MHERVQFEEVIHLFGSIPCGPFSPLQNLNLAVQGEQYQDYLFDRWSDTAITSGGSSSFEWPKNSPGWKEGIVLSIIPRLNMHAGYDGKKTTCGRNEQVSLQTPS